MRRISGRSLRRSAGLRTVAPLVATLTLVSLFCISAGLGQLLGLPGLPGIGGLWGASGEEMQRSIPTRISIPSLDVRAAVLEVGRATDGSIATPTSDPANATGWYRLGPSPGERGTAVIVGHVDTEREPAVFHRLTDLRKGKLIEVSRKDRRVATFTVESVEIFPKASFPVKRIFDVTDRPRLVLVTCGGAWIGGPIGYADNVIVFATLA